MPIPITSLQNSRVKDLAKLAKHNERDQRRVTMVEGVRESAHALAAGLVPLEAYVCPPLLTPQGRAVAEQLARLDARRQTLLMEVSTDIFAKIAYRGDCGGILLVVP